jgi:hypothetical protein
LFFFAFGRVAGPGLGNLIGLGLSGLGLGVEGVLVGAGLIPGSLTGAGLPVTNFSFTTSLIIFFKSIIQYLHLCLTNSQLNAINNNMDIINNNPFKKMILNESSHTENIVIVDNKTGDEFEMPLFEFITQMGLDEIVEFDSEE